MNPEIAQAFQRLREKFRGKLLLQRKAVRTPALKAFDDTIQDFDKPPKTAQPDNETLWGE